MKCNSTFFVSHSDHTWLELTIVPGREREVLRFLHAGLLMQSGDWPCRVVVAQGSEFVSADLSNFLSGLATD